MINTLIFLPFTGSRQTPSSSVRSGRKLRRSRIQEARPGPLPGARYPTHQSGQQPQARRMGRPLQTRL